MQKSSKNIKNPKLKPPSFYVIADKKTGKWQRFDVYFTLQEVAEVKLKSNEVVIKKEFKQ